MQPIVATKGKTTQLRYELPHRVHAATVYPLKAPNGSTIVLYAYESGVGILWRGGRPLKKAAPPSKQPAKPAKVNGTGSDVIMIIDSDDDEPAKPATPALPAAEFEQEEEELDPDQPYPTFVQQVRLALNTEVLHIAVPQVPTISTLRPADTVPLIFGSKMVFTVACADASVRVITLPLSPPPDAAKEKPLSSKSQIGEDVFKVHGHQSVLDGVSMTWTAKGEPSSQIEAEEDMDLDEEVDATATPSRRRRKQQERSRLKPHSTGGFDLLVASHSAELGGLLKIWRFELTETTINVAHPATPYKTLHLRTPASRIAFNTAHYPKQRHSQLLVTDSAGLARIYDPFAAPTQARRAGGAHNEAGSFVATFRSTFESIKNSTFSPAVLAKRKAIIDAAWAADGRHVLALLADGEWGVWDVDRSGPSPPADPSTFALRGFAGMSEKENGAGGAFSPKRGGRNMLAPMTPNTRRRKQETLFQGSSSSSTSATRGGVSVASSQPITGGAGEESVLIWYGYEIHKIADLAKFWTRTASANGGTSLSGPGLQIQDVSLFGEAITSVSQFETTTQASRMAVARDILISAEHRLVITTTTSQPLGRDSNAMFAKKSQEEESMRNVDQALLSRGELDLGGMDRLLENMEGVGTVSKTLTMGGPRKVLFASSAA
ncbi:hypothetical protein T440DRAFT_490502 [Plenodomus tracheiphilus IPT5]|uniref:WD40 repeat-like protein n=1 Tax=Plenodomus tracheiphilus IPT5 TaxID=1408161 RepID=A0A6A7B183_9PLEO|nr:hypothetical protein T440DRAFT_490502 [Plenodomus tracheiphilus IPT5]